MEFSGRASNADMADSGSGDNVDWEERTDWEEYKSGSFVHHMIAGSAAGVSEHVLMFPLDTYKVSLNE